MAEDTSRTPGGRLHGWLNSNVGLLILGALVTTGGGTWLTYVVQERAQGREQQFEIFKIRLEESRKLQEELLTLAGDRAHHLYLVRTRLVDSESGEPGAREFWDTTYQPIKDDWNKRIVVFDSRLRMLFPEVATGPLAGPTPASLFFDEGEMKPPSRSIDRLQEMARAGQLPRTVNGALTMSHFLLYNALDACRGKPVEECRDDPWVTLSGVHLENAWKRIQALADALTTRLLYTPYGMKDAG
jgi:hypothetical protein